MEFNIKLNWSLTDHPPPVENELKYSIVNPLTQRNPFR